MSFAGLILGRSPGERRRAILGSAEVSLSGEAKADKSAKGRSAWRRGPSRWGIFLSAGGICLGAAVGPLWISGLGLGGLLALALQSIHRRAKYLRALGEFEGDYAVMLTALASSLKSGHDPLSALVEQSKVFGPGTILGAGLLGLSEDLRLGASETESIDNFCSAAAHPDLDLFRFSFLLGKKHGGSLSTCLHRLARVTRQRQAFRRKTRAATAMQRLSAIGIAGCTAAVTAIQFSASPEAFKAAWLDPVGQKLLLLGFSLACIGVGWMFYLTRARV